MITAESTASDSGASATDGATLTEATAWLDDATSEVVARAEASAQAAQFGDVLTIHGIRSVAEARKGHPFRR